MASSIPTSSTTTVSSTFGFDSAGPDSAPPHFPAAGSPPSVASKTERTSIRRRFHLTQITSVRRAATASTATVPIRCNHLPRVARRISTIRGFGRPSTYNSTSLFLDLDATSPSMSLPTSRPGIARPGSAVSPLSGRRRSRSNRETGQSLFGGEPLGPAPGQYRVPISGGSKPKLPLQF